MPPPTPNASPGGRQPSQRRSARTRQDLDFVLGPPNSYGGSPPAPPELVQVHEASAPSNQSLRTGTTVRTRATNTAFAGKDHKIPLTSSLSSSIEKSNHNDGKRVTFANEDRTIIFNTYAPVQDPEAELAARILMGMSRKKPKSRELIEKYQKEEEWTQIRHQASAMSSIWNHLGLNYTNTEIPAFRALRHEIWVIAMRMYFHHTPKELVQHASTLSYLNDEVGVLLENYAPTLWGLQGDRSPLGAACALNLHYTVSMYEFDDYQGLLWLYLHQLIFLRSLYAQKSYGDSKLLSSALRDHLVLKMKTISEGCVVPATPNAPVTLQIEGARRRGRKRTADMSLEDIDMENFPFNRPPLAQPGVPVKRTRTQPAQAKSKQPATAAKRKKSLAARSHPNQNAPPSAQFPAVYTGTCLLTAAVLDYLRCHDQPGIDEASYLSAIEKQVDIFTEKNIMRSGNFGKSFSKIMTAWVALQYAIVNAKRDMAHFPLRDEIGKEIARSKLRNSLKNARAGFVGSSDRAIGPVIVILSGIFALQPTMTYGCEVESWVKSGMAKLDEKLAVLNNELGGGPELFED